MRRQVLVYGIVLGVSTILAAILPEYRARLLAASLLFGTLAAATDLTVGLGGLPQFGPALGFGIGAYCGALLADSMVGVLLATALAVFLSGALGGGIAWAALRLRMPPTKYALVTLLICSAIEQGIVSAYNGLGGSNGLSGIGDAIYGGRFVALTCAASFAILGCLNLVRDSEFGLLLRGIRDQPSRIEVLGTDTVRALALSATLSGMAAAIAGVLYAPIATTVHPSLFGITPSIMVLVWVGLGRPGTIIGPFAAATLLRIFQSELGSRLENSYMLMLAICVLAFFWFGTRSQLRGR